MPRKSKLTSMTVSLPATQKAYVKAQANASGCSTPSEYIRRLIHADQRARELERLERKILEDRVREAKKRFDEGEVPLPPFWGGYRIRPETIEFWQGRADRLHDRLVFTREDMQEVLRQRGRFSIVDGVLHLEPGGDDWVVGYIDVRSDAWWAPDHIPGRPILPGMLMVEASAQLGSPPPRFRRRMKLWPRWIMVMPIRAVSRSPPDFRCPQMTSA